MPLSFNINFVQSVTELLAPEDRHPKRQAWLEVLISPIRYVHGLFLAHRTISNREAAYTGQICVMERMLNIQYYDEDVWASPADPTANGHIWIENAASILANYPVWYLAEGQPQERVSYFQSESGPATYPIYFASEYDAGYSFIVWVPSALTFDESEMRARINRYVIAGFNYSIQTY
jgi:hypothetical protein